MFSVDVQKLGDWDRLNRLFDPSYINRRVKNIEKESLRVLANDFLSILKGVLASQHKIGGPALKESTIRRKGHNKKWIDEGDFEKALVVRELSDRFHVGIPADAKNSRGQSLMLISLWVELGTKGRGSRTGMPGRPLFAPAIEEFLLQTPKDLNLDQIVIREFELDA